MDARTRLGEPVRLANGMTVWPRVTVEPRRKWSREPKSAWRGKLSAEQRERVVRERVAGATIREIAAKYGVSWRTVQRILRGESGRSG